LTGISLAKNNGIYGSACEGVKVTGCYIQKCESGGVQLRDCFDYEISGNVIYQNPFGAFSSAADILIYSGGAGGRAVISGNHCLSNNKQGIYFNANGLDVDAVISGNICVALDAAFAEVAAGGSRAHGILAQYTSGAQSRIAITGNVCRNSTNTGVYVTSSVSISGPVSVVGNVCSNNGYTAGQVLAGGVFCDTKAGGVVVSGNVIVDYRGNVTGAITVFGGASGAGVAQTLIASNVVRGSAAYGIYASNYVRDLSITGNSVANAAGSSIAVVLANDATLGDIRITGNSVTRDAIGAGIYVDEQVATRPIVVSENSIVGMDAVTNTAANSGIVCKQYTNMRAVGNVVSGFYWGFNSMSYQAIARNVSGVVVDGNLFKSCAVGIATNGNGAAGCRVYDGNEFTGTATKLSGGIGSNIGYEGRRDGARLVLLDLNAAPGGGTWAIGDRAEFHTPVTGGYIGAVCTVAGNPGTWKSYGAVL
jgi:hypothetical protein